MTVASPAHAAKKPSAVQTRLLRRMARGLVIRHSTYRHQLLDERDLVKGSVAKPTFRSMRDAGWIEQDGSARFWRISAAGRKAAE